MNSILRIYVPSTLNMAGPTYWGFDRGFRSHSWYIKATYTSWSGPLIILSRLRVDVNRSHEINYSFDSR